MRSNVNHFIQNIINIIAVIEAALFKIKSYVLNPGRFSELQSIGEKKERLLSEKPLPYFFEEKLGLVDRSIDKPNMVNIIKWINEISGDTVESGSRSFFDVTSLVNIVKS